MFQQNKTIPFLGAIQNKTDLDEVLARSENAPVGIFKHDSQNMISITNTNFLNRNWEIDASRLEMYLLDVHVYRSVSAVIERVIGVKHDAPQLLVMYKDQLIYHASRSHISQTELMEILDKHCPAPSYDNEGNLIPPAQS